MVVGGGGNDKITAGGGPSVLIGGAGQDQQVQELSNAACRQSRDLVVERDALGRRDDQVAVWERLMHLFVIVVK